MAIQKIWILPVIAFLFVPGSFFISYGIAVRNGHVDSFWPFISETGTCPPESCIFGQFLNIGALLIGLCVYLRHRQIVEFYGHGCQKPGKWWRPVSFIFMWIGFISAFGISMVANFQETSIMAVHMLAALMAFLLGIVYGWGQTIYSYLMKPHMSHNSISHLRLFLVILATAFFAIMLLTGGLRLYDHSGAKNNGTTNETKTKSCYFHYHPQTKVYAAHLTGALSEWLMGTCFMFFILTFAVELRHAEVIPPKLYLTEKLAEKAATERTPLRRDCQNLRQHGFVSSPNCEDVNTLQPPLPHSKNGPLVNSDIYPT